MMKLTALFSIIITLFLFSSEIKAQTQTIDATIRISVCGDLVAEKPEDCDNSDLDNQTCQSLGFGPGTLSCNIGCEFDTTECSSLPTPTPTATQTDDNSVSDTSASNSTPTSTSTSSQITQTITNIPSVIIETLTRTLPPAIQNFDPDSDGRLERSEIIEAVVRWKERADNPEANDECDFNSDNSCNLIDFSVLMYYIE